MYYQGSYWYSWLQLFFIVPSAPLIRGITVVLMCHIFSVWISRALSLLILSYSLTDIFLSLPYQWESMFVVFAHNVCSTRFYRTVNINGEVAKNSDLIVFYICYQSDVPTIFQHMAHVNTNVYFLLFGVQEATVVFCLLV